MLSVPGTEQRPQWFSREEWEASAQASPAELAWWTDARFGLFVHFGVSSLRGVELGWGRETHIAPDGGVGEVADAEYDTLYRELTLADFDPAAWVRAALDAGMRYLVVITKHHDGFHLWDTATSDYSIRHSPYGRDYVGAVVDACHAAGLPVGLYFSQRDWYHPDYDPDGVLPGRDHQRYVAYLKDAVTELLTDYGTIDILWFDAAYWDGMFDAEDWDAEALNVLARELQPGILINNRASIPGDFDTPEQHVGSASRRRPWESCITLGTSWSYKPDDLIKSAAEVVALLVQTLGGDGNLLLDVGPEPGGAIEPRQVDVLREVGRWMQAHAAWTYGSRGGPYLPGEWGASTCTGSTVALFVAPSAGPALRLPALAATVITCTDVHGQPLSVDLGDQAWTVTVPDSTEGFPRVVLVTLDRDAFALTPVPVGDSAAQ